MIKLGSKVKDTITDLYGTATARVLYLSGCVQYEVTSPKLDDGKIVQDWLDEGRLIKIPGEKGDSSSRGTRKKVGGPQNTPSKRSRPLSSSS